MATIGLDKLYYAKITEGSDGIETYATPQVLAMAMKADLSIELSEASLFADDSVAWMMKDFKSGKLTLGIEDLTPTVISDLTGAVVDDNGVIISAAENIGPPVAIGFRALKPDGKYRYFYLYKVKFGAPATNLQTKADGITFQSPTIEGTIMRRNKPDAMNKHPWKCEITEGGSGVAQSTITGWFSEVYEPVYSIEGA
ncbi:hypothetical protein FACS18948_4090 [Clostridia bacterium]|nr:hypothetical protein FACS18948_4090 [Clostridia bacterium]